MLSRAASLLGDKPQIATKVRSPKRSARPAEADEKKRQKFKSEAPVQIIRCEGVHQPIATQLVLENVKFGIARQNCVFDLSEADFNELIQSTASCSSTDDTTLSPTCVVDCVVADPPPLNVVVVDALTTRAVLPCTVPRLAQVQTRPLSEGYFGRVPKLVILRQIEDRFTVLGAGKYGKVYAEPGGKFAVKVQLLSAASTIEEMALKEIQALSQLSRQHFLAFHEALSVEEPDATGRFPLQKQLLFTSLADGDLFSAIMDSSMDAPEAFRFAEQAINAVLVLSTQVHALHRDLKPDNFLVKHDPVSHQRRLMLCDFGMYMKIGDESKQCETAGTMDFMPPSMIVNYVITLLQAVDDAADADDGDVLLDNGADAAHKLIGICKDASNPFLKSVMDDLRAEASREDQNQAQSGTLAQKYERKAYTLRSELNALAYVLFAMFTATSPNTMDERLNSRCLDESETLSLYCDPTFLSDKPKLTEGLSAFLTKGFQAGPEGFETAVQMQTAFSEVKALMPQVAQVAVAQAATR